MPTSSVETIQHSSLQQLGPYNDEAERLRHLEVIAALVQEMHCSIAEVTEQYEPVLNHPKKQAAVHDYLYVFVARKVAEKLCDFH